MTRTAEEQTAWEVNCYGCERAELESIEKDYVDERNTHFDVAMSMMSDAQQEIEMDMKERARKTINRAKWFMKRGRDLRDGVYTGQRKVTFRDLNGKEHTVSDDFMIFAPQTAWRLVEKYPKNAVVNELHEVVCAIANGSIRTTLTK